MKIEELPGYYKRYQDLVSKVREEHQGFIQDLSPGLRERWEALDKRRQLSTEEKPVPYVPFWFAEAFPKTDKVVLHNLGLANFFLYGYNILYDDVLDSKDATRGDLILANLHLSKAAQKFNDLSNRNDEFTSLLQTYLLTEESVIRREKQNQFGTYHTNNGIGGVIGHNAPHFLGGMEKESMIEEYKQICVLPKMSLLTLSRMYNDPALGKRLIGGYESASVAAMFIDDIIDLQEDKYNDAITYPLNEIRRHGNCFEGSQSEVDKQRVRVMYKVCEDSLCTGIQYLEKAREIFESTGCKSWVEFIDSQKEDAVKALNCAREYRTKTGEFNLGEDSYSFQRLHEGIMSDFKGT